MNPILLARHVQDSLRELVHTTLNSSSPAFEGIVDRFMADPGNFLKGPWISVDMPPQQVDEGEEIPFPEVPLEFTPYRHQMEAFSRLSGETMRSTLVAAGTGSGKTESYLWPILDHCRRNKGKPGIKAILIYPMNALATDQARRIAAAISDTDSLSGVRAGIYADAEPPKATLKMTRKSVITHREAMQRKPPDILLTNYRMLDYLLLRGQDKSLWEKNEPETLRFLVVDEMHTFDGAQGADLALLLRRLKYRLKTPQGHLICVGSSATLGSEDDAIAKLREYAETIFGESFDEDAVITETRKTPNEVFGDPEYLDQPDPAEIHAALRDAEESNQASAALRLAKCLFPDIILTGKENPSDPKWRTELGKILKEHYLCQRVLKIIADHTGPASLDAIADGLRRVRIIHGWSEADRRALAELVVALVAWARHCPDKRPGPLFNVRLQLWIREMSRMVSTLPCLEDNGVRSGIELFHALDLDQRALEQVLPIVNCNRCGATAHLGRKSRSSNTYWASLEQLYEAFFDEKGENQIRLFYHDSIERAAGASGGKIVKGLLDSKTIQFTPADHDQLEPGSAAPVWMYDPTDPDGGRIDRTCPACGQARGLLLFGMRAARLTTGITGTLFTSIQNEEQPEVRPRFLMFSDSVQDAAHRAAVAEIRNTLSVYQKSLYSALEETETGSMSLHEVIEHLPDTQLAALGEDAFATQFILKEKTWWPPYKNLARDNISITNATFLKQIKLLLGWEYFVDLSYRAHFSHTLEVNGIATADVSGELLRASAERFASQLRNELPDAPDFDPVLLTRFLFGMIQSMRRQGSVAHCYLVYAIAATRKDCRLNWIAAQHKMKIRNRRVLPSPDSRYSLAPLPITLNKRPTGFEQITGKKATNWYRDWLFRTIGTAGIRYGTDPNTVYPIALQRLEADKLVRRVHGPDEHKQHAWLVEPESVTVTTKTIGLVCDRCGRREIAPRENSDVAIGIPCTRIGCEGHLKEKAHQPRPALHRALLSDRNHRVVAREHTGILEPEERLRVETGFISGKNCWDPNLISATPTLEMGIDIGDLATLLLSSVPPEEANYIQRMGRSGRRDGNALNMVMANSKAHDLQFWEDPTPMLAGRVRPPGVFLAAEEVLLRQVTAFTLDVYVSKSSETGDFGKVLDVLRRRESDAMKGFPVEWLNLVKDRGDDLATEFLSGLPQDIQARADLARRIRTYLTATDQTSIGWRVSAAFDAEASKRARLVEKREEAKQEHKNLRRRRDELDKNEFERLEGEITRDITEINRLIRSGIDDVWVIKFLTDKGILPNYTFPEEGVKLTSILSRHGNTGRNDTTNDEEGLLYLEYSRPASSALTEFAPGQIFYADGRQVEIQRIEIGKDDVIPWTFCPGCSYAANRIEETETSTCPRCGNEMWSDSGSNHEVVELRSVISVDSEEKAAIRDEDQRDQRQFDRVLMPFHGPKDITSSWFTNPDKGTPFGFEFLPHCTFRDFNFGAKSTYPGPKIAGEVRPARPFQICKHCGTLQKPQKNSNNPGKHTPNCKVMREPDIARDSWETSVFLMRKFDTEAIRIVIPVAGKANDNDLKSFAAAVNLGMRRHFEGKVDHLRSTVFTAQLDGMVTVRSLYLYDSVPGGSGYLRQIGGHAKTMHEIIKSAHVALRDCPCNHESDRNGCFRCVKSYRSQFGPGEPNRDRARQLMEAILRNWESLSQTETGIDESIRSTFADSALEKRFLQTLEDCYGSDALFPQVLPGGKRGFVLRAGTPDNPRLWMIEPQVQIDARFKGLPRKRIDFLLTPTGQAGVLPLVLEMDGLEYHNDTVAQDLLDRILMIRSRQVRVWTLSWWDLDPENQVYLNPLAEPGLSPEKIGRLGKALTLPDLSEHADAIQRFQRESSLAGLRRLLDGGAQEDIATRSILIRSFFATGRPLEQLPRQTALSDEGREFLLAPEELAEHIGTGALDLYLACKKTSPSDWVQSDEDIRMLLRAELPTPEPTAKAAYTEAWRGLWRLVNLFQGARGLHVELSGLDTLSPPDMSPKTARADANTEAWLETLTLCDEAFHPLINALIEEEVSGPDRIGYDLLSEGRVVGTMEFGWSASKVAFIGESFEGADWKLIPFDPEKDQIGDTVAKILQALQETKS